MSALDLLRVDFMELDGVRSNEVRGRAPRQRSYRVIAVSLYDAEAHIASRLTHILRKAGWPQANRSFVIREALLRLDEDLAEKSPEGIFRDFVERRARRVSSTHSRS